MENNLPIILGSASKGRKSILEKLSWDFEIMIADIDEKAIRFDDPQKLAHTLAIAKADALIPKIKKDAILITSDQVVDYNGEIREKPEDEEQAREYLKRYNDIPAKTVTGVAVTNTKTGERATGVDIAKVYFKDVPDEVIEKLIAKGDIFSQAGGFSIWDPIVKPYIEKVEGEEESVIGLPVKLTKELIKKVS